MFTKMLLKRYWHSYRHPEFPPLDSIWFKPKETQFGSADNE